MIINFVGLFNQPGYVGEISDETHLARELEKLGHTVNRIQRDVWKAYVEGGKDPNWELPTKADINLIAKWHHFNDGRYILMLKEKAVSPVFYWIWDYMPNPTFPDWHISMAQAADLYLSGELGIFGEYEKLGVKPYYFQMDVCDGDIPTFDNEEKKYDVIFTGSCIPQGNRIKYLTEINKEIPVTIFSWNPDEWFKLGFKECYPAVYGQNYNKIIAQSKIVLGFSVEPNCWGYWSNRVGKVLRAGGFLLQEYAPGMEIQLPNCVWYFNSPEEAIEKIKKFNGNHCLQTHNNFTSAYKVEQLTYLIERYLKGNPDKWNKLPT